MKHPILFTLAFILAWAICECCLKYAYRLIMLGVNQRRYTKGYNWAYDQLQRATTEKQRLKVEYLCDGAIDKTDFDRGAQAAIMDFKFASKDIGGK